MFKKFIQSGQKQVRALHLFEAEAKHWMHKYNLPIQLGGVAYTPAEAKRISETLMSEGIRHQVIKA